MRYLLKLAASVLALAVTLHNKVSVAVEKAEEAAVNALGDASRLIDQRIDEHNDYMRRAAEDHATYIAGLKAEKSKLIDTVPHFCAA